MAAKERPQQHVDVDELAREKVQEIEKSLKSRVELKLNQFDSWFTLLRQIITAADLHRTNDNSDTQSSTKSKSDVGESIYAYYANDDEQFNAVDPSEQFATYSVKWTIRVKAFELVHELVKTQAASPAQLTSKTLDRYLSDLVRLSFVATTSPYDDLKLQGLYMFEFLINRFAFREERQFPGHSVLEQYKVQIMSALRPSFQLDSPPYITAVSSRICSLWISMGLEKDTSELKRIYNNMMSMTIDKLENQSVNQNSKLYTESELEQERIDILGAWAHLYCVAHKIYPFRDHFEGKLATPVGRLDHELLLSLIKPQIPALIDKWWEALRDYALLILPVPKTVDSIHNDNHVYTKDNALKLFDKTWYRLLLSSTFWLTSGSVEHTIGNGVPDNDFNISQDNSIDNQLDKKKYFKFLCGVLMREFCRYQMSDSSVIAESTSYAAKSLQLLVKDPKTQLFMTEDLSVSEEFYKVIYNCLMKHEQIYISQQYLNLKVLLDSIFELIVTKVGVNSRAVQYGIASCIERIRNNMLEFDHNVSQENKSQWVEIHIRTSSIMTQIKNYTSFVLDDVNLLDETIELFHDLLSLKLPSNARILALKELIKLYHILSINTMSQEALSRIFKAKLRVICKVHELVKSGEVSDIPHSHLKETFTKIVSLIKQDITSVSDEQKPQLLNEFVGTLLTITKHDANKLCCPSRESLDVDFATLCLTYLIQIRNEHPNELFDELSCDTKRLYEEIIHQEEDKKAKLQSKLNSQQDGKKPSAKTRPASKIVLKADFSNFYSK